MPLREIRRRVLDRLLAWGLSPWSTRGPRPRRRRRSAHPRFALSDAAGHRVQKDREQLDDARRALVFVERGMLSSTGHQRQRECRRLRGTVGSKGHRTLSPSEELRESSSCAAVSDPASFASRRRSASRLRAGICGCARPPAATRFGRSCASRSPSRPLGIVRLVTGRTRSRDGFSRKPRPSRCRIRAGTRWSTACATAKSSCARLFDTSRHRMMIHVAHQPSTQRDTARARPIVATERKTEYAARVPLLDGAGLAGRHCTIVRVDGGIGQRYSAGVYAVVVEVSAIPISNRRSTTFSLRRARARIACPS